MGLAYSTGDVKESECLSRKEVRDGNRVTQPRPERLYTGSKLYILGGDAEHLAVAGVHSCIHVRNLGLWASVAASIGWLCWFLHVRTVLTVLARG